MKKSLAHLPKEKQTELMLITEKICDIVPQAEMIFLFGSYARGDWVNGPHIQGRGRLTIRITFSPQVYPVGFLSENIESRKDAKMQRKDKRK